MQPIIDYHNMKQHRGQIDPSEYRDLDYLDKPRWISLWHQINEVVTTHPKNVLEVGIGNGLVSHTLKLLGIKTITLDIDARLKPDRIGDVRKLPFKKNTFDTILCAEVLEHIPFADFFTALRQLHKVARGYVIITLPHDFLTYFSFSGKIIPYMKPVSFLQIFPAHRSHAFNGQHYWEIGKKGFHLKYIEILMEKAGFKINKSYNLLENPEHRFFILEKKVK